MYATRRLGAYTYALLRSTDLQYYSCGSNQPATSKYAYVVRRP